MRAALAMLALLPACTLSCTRRDDAPTAMAPTSAAPPIALPAPREAQSMPITSRFVGRWVPEGATGMRSAWSGSFVSARFRGTAVTATIKDEGKNLFHVVVDGEEKKPLRTDKKGEAIYTLAEHLPEGIHEVTLHRRTEARVGEAVFYGFDFPLGGKQLPAAPAPQRRIETIGDSITAGYGNEGPGAACTFVPSEENEYATYGAVAARNLNADHTTIAWSGKTLYEMRGYFDKTFPQRPDSPLWDFSLYQPHVVVVNVGTNNFANVDPGEARFVRLYRALVETVRAAYPKAFIVCALGSMLSDVYPENRHNLTLARKYTKAAVAKLKEAGDTNLDFLEFAEQNHADGLGCGFHPSTKTHRLMGDRLTAFLKERMGW